MDGFHEKKWFVYLGDHHEGPFSLEEIQGKMSHGQVTRNSYVWADGMADWKLMTEVSAFESVLSGGMPAGGASSGLAAAVPAPELVAVAEGGTTMVSQDGPTIATEIHSAPAAISVAEPEAVAEAAAPAPAPLEPARPEVHEEKTRTLSAGIGGLGVGSTASQAPAKPKVSGTWIKRLIPLVIVLGLAGAIASGALDGVLSSPVIKAAGQTLSESARPYLLKLSDTFPFLQSWISPIPELDDVSPQDYEALKAAARAKLETDGQKVAIAVSRSDLTAPVFYIATNLPDGASFSVSVDGVPDTLLNHMSFTGALLATVQKNLAKTQPLRFPDGKAIPRGEYVVKVSRSDAVSTPLTKNIFLGGFKDATYLSRLNEFHERLRAKAFEELTEIKQVSATLESQLAKTNQQFDKLKPGKKKRVNKAQAKARARDWNQFHGTWAQIDAQLNQSFQKWTPDAMKNELFYGAICPYVLAAAQAISQVHGLHHAYFTGAVDAKAFPGQLSAAEEQAKAALSNLKAKIDQADQLQPTPNGMPRRDGL